MQPMRMTHCLWKGLPPNGLDRQACWLYSTVKPRYEYVVRCLESHPLIEFSMYRTSFDWCFAVVSLNKPSTCRNFHLYTLISRFDRTADWVTMLVLYCTAEYEELVTAGRAAVLRSLAAAGVSLTADSIVQETVTTPPQWQQQFGLEHGAAFGMSHGLNQLAVFRPSIKDRKVKGLYFVGASTRPGNGVPLCMISAALAEERIRSDFGYPLRRGLV